MTLTIHEADAHDIHDDAVKSYRDHGFIAVRNILSKEEADHFRQAALEVADKSKARTDSEIFKQVVNVWRDDEAMKALTLHNAIAKAAHRLAGIPLRLWHDQILIKRPKDSRPTEFHQDQPYWPHADGPDPISAWIALCDVPPERGCMSFIPGSHRRRDLQGQNLRDSRSLFTICPDLEWSPRVTLPLKAGDCTFHHGRCAHSATSNITQDPRVAHVVIYMPTTTTYSGKGHVVTDPLNLTPGSKLEGEMFPLVAG
ncbi:MAG: phytanoyl-CoA dioxygenase family protein [Phycisphaera sp.]|nr:phytanoyl-CoA dioxygenase family protein [Phycisphaera sp.]